MPRLSQPSIAYFCFTSLSESPTALPAPEQPKRRTGARARQWLLALAFTSALLGGAAWVGIRTLPWFGPWLADTLRGAVGSEQVTWLEEAAAGVEDRVRQVTSNGEVRSLEEAMPAASSTAVEALPLPLSNVLVPKAPSDVGPVFDTVKAQNDGVWQPVGVRGSASAVIHRTLLHPDSARTYAELFVFSLDLAQVSIHAVAGSVEPKRLDDDEAPRAARPGVIPEGDRGALVAAFNGGFKAEHGRYGMMSQGTTWLAPKATSCTFAANADGALRISSWAALREDAATLAWWRQTPSCMLEDGVLHPGLRSENAKGWGATLEGDTVIRRSAVGLSADGKTLVVGISNSTTAPALARGMAHAGANSVAQLDVNYSYPRFLLYRDAAAADSGLVAEGAIKGLLHEDDEYLGQASRRDFFYVTLNGAEPDTN